MTRARNTAAYYTIMPSSNPEYELTPENEVMWDKFLSLRTDVNKALEFARMEKTVGKPLDADVTLYVNGDAYDFVVNSEFGIRNSESGDVNKPERAEDFLRTIFIVSSVNIVKGEGDGYIGTEFPGVTVSITPSAEPKCARCWTHDKDVGKSAEHPELCPRCLAVIKR